MNFIFIAAPSYRPPLHTSSTRRWENVHFETGNGTRWKRPQVVRIRRLDVPLGELGIVVFDAPRCPCPDRRERFEQTLDRRIFTAAVGAARQRHAARDLWITLRELACGLSKQRQFSFVIRQQIFPGRLLKERRTTRGTSLGAAHFTTTYQHRPRCATAANRASRVRVRGSSLHVHRIPAQQFPSIHPTPPPATVEHRQSGALLFRGIR